MSQFLIFIFFAIISLFLDLRTSSRRGFRLGRYTPDDDFAIARWVENSIRRRNRRIQALKTAASFIKHYEKLFGNHVLSNKHCAVSLNAQKRQITCLSSEYNKYGKKMILFADRFSGLDIDEYFDMLCEIFNYETNYNDVYNSLKSVSIIKESLYSSKPVSQESKGTENIKYEYVKPKDNVVDIKTRTNKKQKNDDFLDSTNKIDVNTASEAELTALPGINVIIAKKIISYRETQRPFKSVDDFFEVMKVKSHFAENLKNMICCNKVNMKRHKKAKAERIIDL